MSFLVDKYGKLYLHEGGGIMIQKARLMDAEAIKIIASLAWKEAYSELIPEDIQNKHIEEVYSIENIKDQIRNIEVIVALRDDYIVGFAAFEFQDDQTFLRSIYVLPQHQKQGVGSELLDSIERRSKRRGSLVVLELENGNRAGESFYKRLGFEEAGYRADEMYGLPIKTIVMKKVV